jgi:hypothetical protein
MIIADMNNREQFKVVETVFHRYVPLSRANALVEYVQQQDATALIEALELSGNFMPDEHGEYPEILEFYFMENSSWARTFERGGELILWDFPGTEHPIWGRCTTGQQIIQDGNIFRIIAASEPAQNRLAELETA